MSEMIGPYSIATVKAVRDRLARAQCWHQQPKSLGHGITTKWWDLNAVDVDAAVGIINAAIDAALSQSGEG